VTFLSLCTELEINEMAGKFARGVKWKTELNDSGANFGQRDSVNKQWRPLNISAAKIVLRLPSPNFSRLRVIN